MTRKKLYFSNKDFEKLLNLSKKNLKQNSDNGSLLK